MVGGTEQWSAVIKALDVANQPAYSIHVRGHALLLLRNVYIYIHPAVVLYVCECVHLKTVVPWIHGYIPVTVISTT